MNSLVDGHPLSDDQQCKAFRSERQPSPHLPLVGRDSVQPRLGADRNADAQVYLVPGKEKISPTGCVLGGWFRHKRRLARNDLPSAVLANERVGHPHVALDRFSGRLVRSFGRDQTGHAALP
jgi:hypothetical protein